MATLNVRPASRLPLAVLFICLDAVKDAAKSFAEAFGPEQRGDASQNEDRSRSEAAPRNTSLHQLSAIHARQRGALDQTFFH